MEGIIPMVYKTLKRNSTRRQYKSLSSAGSGGALATVKESYDINNFYPNGYNHHHHLHYATPPQMEGEWKGHRRHKSFNVGNSGTGGHFSSEGDYEIKPKQLVRFRSHRMFSCITGA